MGSRHRLVAVSLVTFLSVGLSRGQPALDDPELVANWTAPPYWNRSDAAVKNVPEVLSQERDLAVAPMGALPSPPLPLTALTPCRIVDTRRPAGPFGGPALVGNATRSFNLPAGPCPGLPADAGAWSLNFTVIGGPGTFQGGFLTAWPTGSAQPLVSTLNFSANQLIANAAIVPTGTSGAIDVFVNEPAHVIIDINGYYRAIPIVNTINFLSGGVTLVPGTDVSITPAGNTLTIGTDATSSNNPNTIVRRDGSGGFAAGTVALSGNLALPFTSNVAGSVAGILIQNGYRLLHTFGDDNVFLGRDAGNLTMTGADNTASGALALFVNTSGIQNTATGFATLRNNTTGGRNTASGSQALFSNTMGSDNTAYGSAALQINSAGNFNTAIGTQALLVNSSGSDNTAVGGGALAVTTGNNNIAVGRYAGGNLTTGNNNIAIGHYGVAGETATIRIGSASQERAFLAGVRGVTTGAADGLPVLIDSNGQLGTASSAASAKRQIADVGEASSPLLSLRPVSFLYRNDTEGIRQYGLIAEEVARVMPELVQFSPAGTAETVRYHFLAPLLLNELQKEHRRNEEQESRIEKLLARLNELEARVAECEVPTK
jgi:Chaperone of endosialidase